MILTKEQWFRLSIKTRQRWWKETEYGRKEPDADLMKYVFEELTQKPKMLEEGELDE